MNALQSTGGNRVACYIASYIGDYHAPRLLRLSEDLRQMNATLQVAQLRNRSSLYAHAETRRHRLLRCVDVTYFDSGSRLSVARNTWAFLRATAPTHIFVLGYSDAISLTAVLFGRLFKRSVFFMSDSKADDQPRVWYTEAIKRMVIRLYDGALVAGNRHRDYFLSLGFKRRIETGFDVIDNHYFAGRASHFYLKRALLLKRAIIPPKYVLCVSRLIQRKRVDRVFAIFAQSGLGARGYKLVVVGDGPQLGQLKELAESAGVSQELVHIKSVPNHRMPALYAGASALLLGSEYDQWGLCVNEAMACGIPAIVSRRCGVAGEIVTASTGVTFDGDEIAPAVNGLKRIAEDKEYAEKLSAACVDELKKWDLDRYSGGAIRLMKDAAMHRIGAGFEE